MNKQKLIVIQGNNDAHITHLNLVEKINIPNGEIVIEHGHEHGAHQPYHDSLRAAPTKMQELSSMGTLINKLLIKKKHLGLSIQAAAGQVRNHGDAKCLVLEVGHFQEWKITHYMFA